MRTALLPSGDLGRVLTILREAESLAVTLDDPRRLGQVSIFQGSYFYLRDAYDQAITTSQRGLRLAAASGDVDLHALANRYLGIAYHAQGNYRQAIDCCGQTAAFFDRLQPRARFDDVSLSAVLSRTQLALCHAELGTFAEGRALGDAGLRIAEAVAHPGSLMFAYYGVGLLSLRQGDLPAALSRLEQAMGIWQDADLPMYFPRMAAALGAAYVLMGRITHAVSLLTEALRQSVVMARAQFETLCSLSLGEAHLLAGRLEEAHALAERTLALTREHGERGHQAYALRLLGEIAARREPPEVEQAAAHYHQALALAEALGMRPLQAHCHRGLGMLNAATGQREQARTALSMAIELYRAMEMTFWLPQTEAALVQVEGR
jgi:tetratricopeptide (TPR) repeat protein